MPWAICSACRGVTSSVIRPALPVGAEEFALVAVLAPAAWPLVVSPTLEVEEAGAELAVVWPTASTFTLGIRNAEIRAGSGAPLGGKAPFCSVIGPV